jgi:LysM repeat protein
MIPMQHSAPALRTPTFEAPALRAPAFKAPAFRTPAALKSGKYVLDAILLIILLAFLALTIRADAQESRPRPTLTPVSAPAEGEVVHVVKKGDTLWDIAKAYLKDPFRWPEIFKRNTDVVENPHWIYPGESIRIPAGEVKPEVLARISTTSAPAVDRTVFSVLPGMVTDRLQSNGEVLGRGRPGSVRSGEADAAPFVDREGGPDGAGRLSAAYDRPGIQAPAREMRFHLRDAVFVELPDGSQPRLGDRYLAFTFGPLLAKGEQVMVPTAIVQVESFAPGEPTVARIIRQFGEIALDQPLIPFVAAAVSASASPSRISNGPTGEVVWVNGDPVLPSIQSYVVLRVNGGASLGDQFTLIDDKDDPTHPAPPVPAAVAQVVRVTRFAVTAIVLDHDQPTIKPGMPVRLTARMQ